jgi:hypothetical protein
MREIIGTCNSRAAALDTGESWMLAKYLRRKMGFFLMELVRKISVLHFKSHRKVIYIFASNYFHPE